MYDFIVLYLLNRDMGGEDNILLTERYRPIGSHNNRMKSGANGDYGLSTNSLVNYAADILPTANITNFEGEDK